MSSVIWAQRARHSRAQRGMTLVELMVGITVGLFVVAAAATLMSAQLVDNRKLLSVNQAIENHPVEKIGGTLRGYMTAMKQISVGG